MPSSPTTLVLSTAELNGAMEYKPNLMPFHIEYDGPAPVSTYMKVEGVRRGVGVPESEDVDIKVDEGEGSTKDEKGEAEVERYVSTFRGRTIHGVDVGVPSGYSGLVLRSEGGMTEESKGKGKKMEGKTKGKANGPQKAEKIGRGREVEEDNGGMIKTSGKFSSIRVWNADVPVDGGRDEYMRGLSEWAMLAGEVSEKGVCESKYLMGSRYIGRCNKA